MTQCEHCGARTGLHGFSFDTKGSYEASEEDVKCSWLPKPDKGEWESEEE